MSDRNKQDTNTHAERSNPTDGASNNGPNNDKTETEQTNATGKEAENVQNPAANADKERQGEDSPETLEPDHEQGNDPKQGDDSKSKRGRKPTPKMQALQEEEQQKREQKFHKAYESWKLHVREIRKKLKQECTEEEIGDLCDKVETTESSVLQVYNSIRTHGAPSQQTKRRMDACSAVTNDLRSLLQHRLAEVGEDWNDHTERLRLHTLLDREYAHSVYGASLLNPSIVISEAGKSDRSGQSEAASIAIKRTEAEAQLAAKEAELKAMEEEEVTRASLEQAIETQRREIRKLETQREIKVAKAKVTVYNKHLEHTVDSSPPELNPNAPVFNLVPTTPAANSKTMGNPVPTATPCHTDRSSPTESLALAQALQTSMMLGRLPLPEPTVFNGNPIQYTEWKASFLSLIDNKAISTQEKFYFLKKYAGEEARKAIQGYFLTHTDKSYQAAWKTLEERYGNPFTLQKAFREKLATWPVISNKDGEGLRDFADFLQGCQQAMAQIPSLQILHDCMENQKLMNKLPSWASTRWNRKVTKTLQDTGEYPNFDSFVEFVVSEAKVACNPISSLLALNEDKRPAREPKRKHANVMATNVNSQDKGKESKNKEKTMQREQKEHKEVIKKCPFCEAEGHYLPKCPVFSQKSLDSRRKFIQEQKRCYGCLRVGHDSRNCQNKHTCETCRGKHPTCLHDTSFKGERKTETEKPGSSSAATLSTNNRKESTMTSAVVPVWVSTWANPQRERLVYALLDTQSNVTFVDRAISEALSAESQPTKLKLTTITAESDITCERVTGLRIRGYTSNITIDVPSAYTREHIPIDPSHIPTNDTAKNWTHLRTIAKELPPLLDCDAGLLIGYNCPQALVPREVITGGENEPFAVRMDLGWSVIGRASPAVSCLNVTAACHTTTAKEAPLITPTDALRVLEKDFQDSTTTSKTISQEDIMFLKVMDKEITMSHDGHYEMPLPFKKQTSLPNNRQMAVIRLNHLKRKMENNSTYQEEYTEFMNAMVKRGDAERAPENSNNQTWYIPHHGVYHPRKKKLRVVFDCSAKFQGTALNDHLLVGPDLTNSLTGVLCRFRQHPVAVMCDIEKMFHQFHVKEDDRDFLRFLWWEHGDLSTTPKDYRMKVHLFGAASSPGCANYGLKRLAQENQSSYPLGATFIKRNFYVDDGVTSEPTEERAIQVIAEARALCALGGMRLHKFVSNSLTVIQSIPVTERATNMQSLNLSFDDLPMERALGMQWSVESDTIHFSHSPHETTPSRRSILATVASLYDPLGLIAPYLLQGKRILQEMCNKGIGWDDPPPEDLCQKWETWTNDLKCLESLSIPRCYTPQEFNNSSQMQLHHFCDASLTGYGTCSYLRVQNEQGNVHCSLIAAKARVAPTKVTTVPRLELSAALVSAEIATVLKEELDITITQEFFWTDSRVVLGYLNNDTRKFHIFVANRVQKIKELTSPSQWHYVPTNANPADYASRGLSAKEIATTSWFSGPDFLWKKDLAIPDQPTPELKPGDPEVKTKITLCTQASSTFDWNTRLTHCSSWTNATRAVARILRLAHNVKGPRQPTVAELRNAELKIIIGLQKQAFPDDYKRLRSNTTLPTSSKLYQVDAFLTNDLIRVGGRLTNAPLSMEEKHPIVLPKDGHITKLIIQHFHERSNHQGRGMTLNEIRSHGYWIMGGSHAVSTHIHKCVICRKARRPSQIQKMADLPQERVEPSPPFTHTGMDCFGPFITKNGRKETKRYGLLFTCFSSRAVHLEMIDDLSTDAFISGLRCFIALRGTVKRIQSDQGSNFIGAKNVFSEACKEMDANRIERFLTKRECEFIFNAPSASHAGGVWERQIRSIRNVLDITLSLCPGRLDDSSLRTLLYEAMATVNSRPLTVTNLNDPTAPEPLTPNHILTMKATTPLPPPGNFTREDVYLRKRWRRVQYLAQQFWTRWKQEYLRAISQRQKWQTPRRNLMVGDIVIIMDADTARNTWPLGRIEQTFTNDDGLVRKVKVKVGSAQLDKLGKRKSELKVLERPIQKVILLLEAE